VRAFAQAPSAESTTRGNGSTFSLGVLATMLVCAAAFLGIGAPAANAATAINSYQLGSAPFGSGGSDGNVVDDIASSPTNGNVFISVHGQEYVNVFSGGSLLTTINIYGATGLSPQALTVDPTSDALYVADASFGTGIARFVSDGAPTPTYTYDPSFAASGLSQPGGIAVDPVTHDVLVVDRGTNRVIRFAEGNGAEISSFDGSDTTGGAFGGARAIAVGPSGAIYVLDSAGNRVERFDAAGASQGALPLPTNAVPAGVAANPSTGDVAVIYTLFNQTYIRGFTATGTEEFSARVTAALAGATVSGLDWDGTTDRIYVGRGDGTASAFVPALQPGVDVPTATTGRDTAHVEAEVAPGGDETVARLEYCPSTSACDSYPVSEPFNPSNPWKRGPEHEGLTATTTIEDDLPLGSNAAWQVRVSANNNVTGTDNTSAALTFDSPLLVPGVTTGPASSVTASGAELNGTIETLASTTTYHFEYGTSTSYGGLAPANREAPAGNIRTPRNVSQPISGLQAGVTYHYRLVATNSIGEAAGADRTFTTPALSELFPQRAYEQVTPVDKEGAQVLSDFHGQVSDDGSAITVTTVQAPAAAPSSMILQNHLIRRGAGDWLHWKSTDAPQDAMPGLNEASTVAMSDDFEHALVISNRVLDEGGIAGGGNLYVKDMATGDYTFVAGAPGAGSWSALVGIQANEKVFLDAAPDFSWILFWGIPRFLPEASGTAIYRWTRATGELKIESLLPGEIVPPFEAQLPDSYKRELPAASTDGSVLAYGLASGVYRRENGETKPVSASQIPGDPAGTEAQPGVFDGMTPDGRYIFFRSGARLTEDAPEAGPAHLYRYDAVEDDLEFLTLAGPTLGVYGFGEDGQTFYTDEDGVPGQTVVWHAGQVRTITTERPLQNFKGARTSVSSNGRYFAWISGVNSGPTGEEGVHLYDAVTEEETCISCLPGGGSGGNAHTSVIARGIGNREPQVVTDSGTVFFDTTNRLLAADHNGARDVYAYQNGRLDLISPGTGDYDAFFVDASVDGSDVFFQTDQGLVGQDTDGESDVYDARVGGGFASQNPPPPPGTCAGAECTQAGGKPDASPPMATAGAANPATPHKKHKKHKNKKHKHKKHKKNHSKTAASKGR
jgi:hypothetical protein